MAKRAFVSWRSSWCAIHTKKHLEIPRAVWGMGVAVARKTRDREHVERALENFHASFTRCHHLLCACVAATNICTGIVGGSNSALERPISTVRTRFPYRVPEFPRRQVGRLYCRHHAIETSRVLSSRRKGVIILFLRRGSSLACMMAPKIGSSWPISVYPRILRSTALAASSF